MAFEEETPYEKPIKYEPIFNLPAIIIVLAASFVLVHLTRTYLFNEETDYWFVATFSFIPASFGPLVDPLPVPNSWLWSSVSYSFLHGSWTHLLVNLVWMTAFGSPVAKRFGWYKFLLLTIFTSIGGAALHFAFFQNEFVPVIGASGAVSGYMGAAARFAFQNDHSNYGKGFNANGRALTLIDSFKNKQFLIFFGVWVVVNFVFGSGVLSSGQVNEPQIAWQAHIGGFATGLLLFSLFDREKINDGN